MARQTEACDVGHGINAGHLRQLCPDFVAATHQFSGHAAVGIRQPALFFRRRHDANAQGFGQVQLVPGSTGAVAFQMFEGDFPGHRQSKNGLRAINAVPPSKGKAELSTDMTAAGHHRRRHFRGQCVDGPAENGDRRQGSSAHGVDIADGVGGSDPPKIKGVIHDGHEKVSGAQYRPAIVQIDGRGVIVTAVAYQQLWECPRINGVTAENGGQHIGRNFTATARSVAVLGQAGHLSHGICREPFFTTATKSPCYPSELKIVARDSMLVPAARGQ